MSGSSPNICLPALSLQVFAFYGIETKKPHPHAFTNHMVVMSMSDDSTAAAIANWKEGQSTRAAGESNGNGNGTPTNGDGNGNGNGNGARMTGATPVEGKVKTMDSTKLS
jgi:hypothetical protein